MSAHALTSSYPLTSSDTLSLEHLTKSYHGHNVVSDLSLSFEPHTVTSLIGPNGAGKSTVMGMMARLIEPTSGNVSFKGKPLNAWDSKTLAQHLAILTQHNNTNMKLTIRELVAFGRFPYSGANLTATDYTHIDQALSYMELTDMADSFIDELSGGQQQRAFIAMVIAQDTDYVLLDEPTNNLDIYHASNLMRCARRLVDELGKTVIMVLHEINYAAFYSDNIIALKDGRIAAAGTVGEVMRPAVLKDIYNVDFHTIDIQGKPLSIYY